jgi:hypothetical protein
VLNSTSDHHQPEHTVENITGVENRQLDITRQDTMLNTCTGMVEVVEGSTNKCFNIPQFKKKYFLFHFVMLWQLINLHCPKFREFFKYAHAVGPCQPE